MKILVLALTIEISSANAEVVSCPELYPTADVALQKGEANGNTWSRIRPSRLSGSYFEVGDLYVSRLVVPLITKAKNGWDIDYPLGPPDNASGRWLVCKYGGAQWGTGNVERWMKLPQTFTRCREQVREVVTPGHPSKWTQTATCS